MTTTMTTKLKIRVLLLEQDKNFASVARELGVDRTLVYRVAAGERKSPRVRRALARIVNMRVEELWPDDATGRRAA